MFNAWADMLGCTSNKTDPYASMKVYDMLAFEQSYSIGSPIRLLSLYKTTSTFSESTYKQSIARAEEILRVNNWTMGHLIRLNQQTKLAVNPDRSNPKDFIEEQVCDSRYFSPETCPDLERAQFWHTMTCGGITEDFAFTLDKKYCRWFFVRDHEDFSQVKNFGIMFCINHLIGDGATMYKLFNMMDTKGQVTELTVNRVMNVEAQLAHYTCLSLESGENIVTAFENAAGLYYMKKAFYRSGKDKYRLQRWNFKVNIDEITRIKNEHKMAVEAAGGSEASGLPEFITTNDILVSWLFKKSPKCQWAQIPVDLRSRLPGLNENLAGNYIVIAIIPKESLQSPALVRNRVKACLAPPQEGGLQYAEIPPPEALKQYLGGDCSNWCSFYRSIDIEGLELVNQCPFEFMSPDEKMMGMNIVVEEYCIIYRCNDRDIGFFILCGHGKWEESTISGDVMYGSRL